MGKNLWRYEYRLSKKINKYLGGAIVTRITDLQDPYTFIHIIDAWEQMFHKIELVDVDALRQAPYNPEMDYNDHLLVCGVRDTGGVEMVMKDLKEQVLMGNMTDRQLRYKREKINKAVALYQEVNKLPPGLKQELLRKVTEKAQENRMKL